MLRNKLGKPSQVPSTTEGNNNTESKPTTITSIPTNIKPPSGISSGIGIGGIKPPTIISTKPQTNKPPATQSSQGLIPQLSTANTKNSQTSSQQTQPKTQQKPQTIIRPQQIKTDQQRLAELVTKKAAEMKKQYQMINKISSQVGSQKKTYVKEYEAKFSHVLKTINKKILTIKGKQNTLNLEKDQIEKSTSYYLSKQTQIFWSLNEWDTQNHLKQYVLANFKPDKYL